MTQQQANTLTMWATVDAVLRSQTKLWTPLKAFETAVQTFRSIRQQIDPDARSQEAAITGVTLDKQVLRSNLCRLAIQLAANIHAFALITGNNKLHNEADYKPTHFLRLRDNMLPVVVRSLIDHATIYLEQLGDYGITDNDLTQLTAALNAYENNQTAPRHAIIGRKVAIANIGQLIKQGNASIDIMDKLVGNWATANPDFVANFRNACHIIDRGHHKAKSPVPPKA
jgi:hypothetical protein